MRAKIKALTNPVIKNGMASSVKYCKLSKREMKLAPAIIGTAIINVKSAAVRWFRPVNTPPDIVAPERENPGHKEKH